MPIVKKQEHQVEIQYELMCDYKRAEALAQNLEKILHDDDGLNYAEDVTCGFDRNAVVKVGYNSLKDANRLDAKVRSLLALKVNYYYKYESGYVKPYTEILT